MKEIVLLTMIYAEKTVVNTNRVSVVSCCIALSIYRKGKEKSRSCVAQKRLSVVLFFTDGRYAENIKTGCLMNKQPVFCLRNLKEVYIRLYS